MPIFHFTFTVRAPLSAVAQLHHDTRALKMLTPPPVFVQIHRMEPLGEGSISDFTLWFGPMPIRWTARHTRVDPLHGFTDTQVRGPMRRWAHTHTFSEESSDSTRITEHIEYEHESGLRGLLSRLLFPPPGLTLMFCYRRLITRRQLEKRKTSAA